MTYIACSCGWAEESSTPKDSVEYHMMYHAGYSHMVSLTKDSSTWKIEVAPNAYPTFGYRD